MPSFLGKLYQSFSYIVSIVNEKMLLTQTLVLALAALQLVLLQTTMEDIKLQRTYQHQTQPTYQQLIRTYHNQTTYLNNKQRNHILQIYQSYQIHLLFHPLTTPLLIFCLALLNLSMEIINWKCLTTQVYPQLEVSEICLESIPQAHLKVFQRQQTPLQHKQQHYLKQLPQCKLLQQGVSSTH